MIYSVIPPEQLFYDGWEQAVPQVKEVVISGITMQVHELQDGKAQIVRLISPNPMDYMNPRYMPGTIVQYTAAFE